MLTDALGTQVDLWECAVPGRKLQGHGQPEVDLLSPLRVPQLLDPGAAGVPCPCNLLPGCVLPNALCMHTRCSEQVIDFLAAFQVRHAARPLHLLSLLTLLCAAAAQQNFVHSGSGFCALYALCAAGWLWHAFSQPSLCMSSLTRVCGCGAARKVSAQTNVRTIFQQQRPRPVSPERCSAAQASNPGAYATD